MTTPSLPDTPIPDTDTDTDTQNVATLLLPSDDWILAGRGNALTLADEHRRHAADTLQDLFNHAPSLRITLNNALRRALEVDPQTCGLEDRDRRITLLDFAARLLVNPAMTNSVIEWSTWGVEEASSYAAFSARHWLQALTSVLPKRILPTAYWDTRMPGQSVSRRSYAEKNLREHFRHTLDLNYGLDRLQTQGWKIGQLDEASRYAQLHWRQPGEGVGVCPGALLIQSGANDKAWLIYRPMAKNPVRAFQNEAALLEWAHKNQHQLWSTPSTPLASGSDSAFIQVTSLVGDAFSGLLDSILTNQEQLVEGELLQAPQSPMDWVGLEEKEAECKPRFRKALPDALDQQLKMLVSGDEALAAQEVHFDSLDERLPLGWRKQRINRQEKLLSAYLGNDTEPTSPLMAALRTQQAKLDEQDAALQKLLSTLPENITLQSWSQAYDDRSRFDCLSQHFASSLLLEADFQQLLGELSSSHLQWVHELVERPEPSLQRPVMPSALKLVVGDRSWMLTGLMTLQALPDEEMQAPDTTLLLYKPGFDGGLATYESEHVLFDHLLNTLYGAWPEMLLESAWPQDSEALLEQLDSTGTKAKLVSIPITNHAFDYLTQTHLALLTDADDATKLQLRWKLGITNNSARQQAFERLAERNRTSHLHTNLHPLSHLDAAQRTALAAQVDALRNAMLASSQLLAKDLPERGQFARNQLNAHLRSTLSLSEPPKITLDIADYTGKKRVPVPESGFGHAYKIVTTFSAERSHVPLEEFLLWALNDDLTLRLGNANIIFDDSVSDPELKQKITLSTIANLVKTLDLAGAYEQKILDAFTGDGGQTDWEAQWRQETLRRPFEHQLKILALSQPQALDEAGKKVLELYCQEQLDASRTPTVRHHSLVLRPGTAPDGSSHQLTLSGMFLLEPSEGPLLVLMPDAPNGKVISQYASREAACQALENLAMDTDMRTYLASRPLDGDSSTHLSYIDQALLKRLSGFIAIGETRSESFAQMQINLLMGRLITKHRASSRSQVDLYLEKEAIRHGRVYDYIKLAVGFIPGVGTLVALYDGWHAANESVEAFLRGAPGEGIEHLNSVFQSLVDALFDVVVTTSFHPSGTQARTRTHNRQQLAGLRSTSVTRQARPDPFHGYTTEAPTGPWINHPEAYGKGVYRHVESGGDYIRHQEMHYLVEWDTTYLTWRLKGGSSRSYKQPIRLDEQGTWTTHGGLSGRLVDSGLAGGGAYLARLYQQGWETLRTYTGRQPALRSPRQVVQDIVDKRKAQVDTLNAKLRAFKQALSASSDHPVDPASLQRALQESVDQLESFVKFSFESLEALRRIRAELGRLYQGMRDEVASGLGRQHPALVQQRHLQMQHQFNQVKKLEDASPNNFDEVLEYHRQLSAAQEKLCQSLSRMEEELHRTAKVTETLRGGHLTDYQRRLDTFDIPLDPNGFRTFRLSIQAGNIIRTPGSFSDDLLLLMRQVRRELLELRHQLFSHQDLPAADLSRAQRYKFLQQVKARYQRYDNYMTTWQDSFPTLVTPQSTQWLRKDLKKLVAEVDEALSASAPIRRAKAAKRGSSKPRIFDTVDQQQLIGHEVRVDGQVQIQVGSRLDEAGTTTFTQSANNLWQSSIRQPSESLISMSSLLAMAAKRLKGAAAQHAKLRQYQALNMTPASLEDLANGYAATLKELAQSITRKGGERLEDVQRAVALDLQNSAKNLERTGQQLRIEQTKIAQQPGFGHLEYLHVQEEVSIHWSRTLEPAKNKQGNAIEYLEEYRIDDKTTGDPLWYAHFHFKNRPKQGFARLEAGHLKLAAEVNQRAGVWRGVLTESQADKLFGGLRPAEV